MTESKLGSGLSKVLASLDLVNELFCLLACYFTLASVSSLEIDLSVVGKEVGWYSITLISVL